MVKDHTAIPRVYKYSYVIYWYGMQMCTDPAPARRLTTDLLGSCTLEY